MNNRSKLCPKEITSSWDLIHVYQKHERFLEIWGVRGCLLVLSEQLGICGEDNWILKELRNCCGFRSDAERMKQPERSDPG